MRCRTVLRQREKSRPTIQSCPRCGGSPVSEYEFGILCERCEAGLYFGMWEKYSPRPE